MAQQVLSVIASHGGRFTRVADLCQLVRHLPHLDRATVEAILSQLAANGYLQPHGFKNQYAAAEALHELVDFRLIHGNFAVGSQTVDLYHGTERLGEVPAINLLRVHRGSEVRFAGKCWRVQNAWGEKIVLQPTGPCRAIDFAYSGSGVRTETFVANRVWQLIHTDQFREDLFAQSLRLSIAEARTRLRAACAIDDIPYARSNDGVRYFTFAGCLVNKAIGLISQKTSFEASDTSLLVASPIDWAKIPSDPAAYDRVFHSLFELPSDQSLFQTELPLELQLRECLEVWLKDQATAEALRRLVSSSPVEVEPEYIAFFSDAG